MTTTVLLHVGAFKTATSAIQGLFTLHGDELRRKHGVLYPQTFRRVNSGVVLTEDGQTDSFGHHTLAHLLRNVQSGRQSAEVLDQHFGRLRAEVGASGCATIFLSTELLTFCSRNIKARIVEALSDYDLKIIYAVRNPVDFVESLNNQRIKSGMPAGPAEHDVKFLENIEAWEALLPEGRVSVLPFASRDFDAFIAMFFAQFGAAGLAEDAAAHMLRANSAASAEGAFARTALDRHLPPPDQMSPRIRHGVNQAVVRMDQRLERRSRLETLSGVERERIARANRAQMEEICRRYVSEANWPSLLDVAPGREETDPASLAYSLNDLHEILNCLVACQELVARASNAEPEPVAAAAGRVAAGARAKTRRRARRMR